MRVWLDAASKRILVALVGSPKTPFEVSRIYGIPVTIVWQQIRRLQDLGFVYEVLTFVDSTGKIRRYFEGFLPVDMAADEVVIDL